MSSQTNQHESSRHDPPLRVRVPVRIDFAGGWSDVAYFAAREGGAVLNAAIDRFIEGAAAWGEQGLDFTYRTDLPPDSHLGTSAAVNVAWLRLTYGLIGREVSPIDLAEQAYRLEKLLGVAGGRQDQYAAALGGFHFLKFAGSEAPAAVERIVLPEDVRADLEQHCTLCDSGVSSTSGKIHASIWARYRDGDSRVASIVRRMRDSASAAREALGRHDWRALAAQVAANREAARELDANLIPPALDRLFDAAQEAGAWGSKACGAGGGGCLFFLGDAARRDDIEAALRAEGARIMPFRFYDPDEAP